MASRGYKKYMKEDRKKGGQLIKIFIVSFFGMLLICTLMFNYLSKMMTVDTSIGDYKEQQSDIEDKKIVDVNSLEMIQNEDQGRNFSDLMAQEEKQAEMTENESYDIQENKLSAEKKVQETNTSDQVYKVFIGTYTSVEQAKVAKDIMLESGSTLNPIVKCLGPNNYTLQVGIFKSRQGAETMLNTVQQNHLPGRIVQDN